MVRYSLADTRTLLRHTLADAAVAREIAAQAQPLQVQKLFSQGFEMIILSHPRATKPRNCRLPLAVLALAAVLEGREEYRIIDGNLEEDPTAAILNTINLHQVE